MRVRKAKVAKALNNFLEEKPMTKEEQLREEQEKAKREEAFKKARAEQEYRASIPGCIDTLEKEIAEKQKELSGLKSLHEQFPDLKRNVNRWNRVRYCSKSVNSKVQRFDMSHNCGCCADSPLEVWPYLETEHGNVYSDPARFQVGEKNWISGDDPYPEWKKPMRKAGIPEEIIGAVSMHFKRSAEERKEIAAASDYEDDD